MLRKAGRQALLDKVARGDQNQQAQGHCNRPSWGKRVRETCGRGILGRDTGAQATGKENTQDVQGTAKRPMMWLEKNT